MSSAKNPPSMTTRVHRGVRYTVWEGPPGKWWADAENVPGFVAGSTTHLADMQIRWRIDEVLATRGGVIEEKAICNRIRMSDSTTSEATTEDDAECLADLAPGSGSPALNISGECHRGVGP